jgi:short-subunit dehydrogenase
LGTAFAEALARRGFDLVVVARRRERLEALAEELRDCYEVAVQVLAADLTQAADLQAIESRVASDASLTVLVNNAGVGTIGRFAELDPDREEAEVRLNVVALSRLTRAALPGMIARGLGGIINVSSVTALLPGPYHATYGATKAFVNSFTEALHEELRGTGVRVQALCPGFTRTEFQERAGVASRRVPSFAWMSPEYVAEASLAALRRGALVCVPGPLYQSLTTLVALLPRSLVRSIHGITSRRVLNPTGERD